MGNAPREESPRPPKSPGSPTWVSNVPTLELGSTLPTALLRPPLLFKLPFHLPRRPHLGWYPGNQSKSQGAQGARWMERLTSGLSSGHDRGLLASACVWLPAQNGVRLSFLPLALPPLLLLPQLWLALPLRNKTLKEKRVTRSMASPVPPEHRLPPRPLWPPRLSPREAFVLSSLPGELRVPSPGPAQEGSGPARFHQQRLLGSALKRD